MINEDTLRSLSRGFRRITCLPITRSTYREMQNVIATNITGSVETANKVLESLVTGKNVVPSKEVEETEMFDEFIRQFSEQTSMAKDVFEKGEFISLVTSDNLNVAGRLAFLHRIRRVDGQEIQFVSDPHGSLQLIRHLVGRLTNLLNNPATSQVVTTYADEISEIRSLIDQLIPASKTK